MVNICFISYYGLRESLLCASNSLSKLGHEVINFSLMENERNDNKDKVYDMLISTTNLDICQLANSGSYKKYKMEPIRP